MWRLRAAALLVLLWGLAPAVMALYLADPLEADVVRSLALRALSAAAAAAALLRRGRVVRWIVAAVAALFTALGLLLLHGGPAIEPWAWIDSPRVTVMATAVTTTLAALVLALLLGPHRRVADNGPPAAATLLGASLVIAVAAGAWQTLARYPTLVLDGADLLSPEQERQVARFHRLLRHDHDIDYRLVTGRDLGDIDRYAARHFAEADVGRASDGAHGLLLVVDAATDTLRMEVSRTLEPVYVDAFVAYIEQRQMAEFLADGRVADGVLATTELLVTRAQRAARGLALDDALRLEGSAGGGARATARLQDEQDDRRTTDAAPAHSDEPKAVLEAYRRAMAGRNDNPDLEFYTRGTRTMLKDWTVTPAQMDNVAESLRRCPVGDIRREGTQAVLRAPLDERTCPPYFFLREDGRWRLDLEPMGRVIRFGRNNAWHLDFESLSRYRFAFRDWRFDSRGYPIAVR